MSSQIEEFAPLSLGKGSVLRTFVDHGKPNEPSWVEVTYDGKEDSDMLVVPHHWHKDHDEVVQVVEGRIICYLDGKELVLSAGDPPTLIERGHVHGFSSIKGEFFRVTERTRTPGDFKARFFQDMLQGGRLPGFLMMMRVAYDGDMYPSLPGGFKSLDWLLVTIVGFIAKPFVPAKPAKLK